MQTQTCRFCGSIIAGAERRETGNNWLMEAGDCLQLMQSIDTGTVDAVITDPPYGSGGDTAADRMRSAKDKYVSTDASYQRTLADIDGDCLHPEAWQSMMETWARQCRRVLAPDGVFASFIDWRQCYFLIKIMRAAGIKIRGVAVWDKGGCSRPYRGGFRLQTEYIVWAASARYRAPTCTCLACYSTRQGRPARFTSPKSR